MISLETKKPAQGGFQSGFLIHAETCKTFRWCGRRDSNSHTSRRQNLNLVCLPIPPRPHSIYAQSKMNLLCKIWGGRWVSNPRHRESQSRALPTELRPPYCAAHVTYNLLHLQASPNGAPGRIRTCDHPLRRRVLYPTELRALVVINY